jgi:hypothetical protein
VAQCHQHITATYAEAAKPVSAWSEERTKQHEVIVMSTEFFKKDWIKTSDYPADFIPDGAKLFTGVDEGPPDGDCTVKGFYKDGQCHVQSVEHRKDT